MTLHTVVNPCNIEIEILPLILLSRLRVKPSKKQILRLSEVSRTDVPKSTFILLAFEIIWQRHGLLNKAAKEISKAEIKSARADAMELVRFFHGNAAKILKYAGSVWTRWVRCVLAGRLDELKGLKSPMNWLNTTKAFDSGLGKGWKVAHALKERGFI